uniref:Uncharacterized protein n=1 Tax=Octopus bimaculoides TaxID=37653 RepID=A0A0L8I261_OCTBM
MTFFHCCLRSCFLLLRIFLLYLLHLLYLISSHFHELFTLTTYKYISLCSGCISSKI